MILEFSHRVAAPQAAVFAFHTNPANLARILDGWPGFELVKHDETTQVGSITWVKQRMFGCVPIVSAFEHTLFEAPDRFGEKLVRGPFKHFRHIHEFIADADETLVVDKIDVLLPWYFGGEITTRLIVASFLAKFFAFRHASLDRLLEQGAFETNS